MKVSFINAIILCLLLSNEVVSENVVTNVFKSIKDTATGVVKKIPNSLPSVETIFAASKNLLVGYPFKLIFKAINWFCSTALSINHIKPRRKVSPQVNQMNLVLLKKHKKYSVSLQYPELLWKNSKFRKDLNTVILVTGWTSNINETNDAMKAMANAYNCRGNVNFIALDTGSFVDTLYTWSAFNTEAVGYLLAKALVSLVSFYPVEKLHLIGHSLGAHIAGSAGRNLHGMTFQLIPRITGLDPANPCFNEGENLSGLSRGDADFVDVIHTNSGVLGKREAIGDCDFYPNGVRPLPPGCLSIVCAHARSWELYAETVYPGNEYTFMAVKCGSLPALNSGYCRGYKYPMGYAVPFNLKGNYFLKTKRHSPYGEDIHPCSVLKSERWNINLLAMNIPLIFVLCSSVLLQSGIVWANIFTSVAKSTVDIASGVAQKIPESIPSPEALFSSSKNLLVGYPFEVAAKAINIFCSAALSENQIKPKTKYLPELDQMNFVLLTPNDKHLIPLKNPQQLWNHHSFNSTLKTEILVTGWTSNINETNEALQTIWEGYKCRGNVNFVAVDTAKFVDTLYSWSAFNTEELGKLIAEAIEALLTQFPNYSVKDIHLIGHSLGAHIVGSAGRNFAYKNSNLLSRITGLDPANPCFNEGEKLTGLSRGDADFVDIIHSNSGVLGKRDPIGDCDFYPNGLSPLPPGCFTIVCAHGRAWEYYAESIYPGNENVFEGVKCGSLTALNTGYCPGKKFSMGYAVPHNLKGNYFLATNSDKPYGKGPRGTDTKCAASRR
ncbi:Vitellogenin-1 [Pseudolycoriella hygida]|uniref:Vitellogenin-1 n=1 Tax=Pseudolycoriella hygida TaxID=35572 RepID=A0A9Q0MY79_9DIPT|nr:Vitellogenin-1 [Pseudolycoriella hygida]